MFPLLGGKLDPFPTYSFRLTQLALSKFDHHPIVIYADPQVVHSVSFRMLLCIQVEAFEGIDVTYHEVSSANRVQ